MNCGFRKTLNGIPLVDMPLTIFKSTTLRSSTPNASSSHINRGREKCILPGIEELNRKLRVADLKLTLRIICEIEIAPLIHESGKNRSRIRQVWIARIAFQSSSGPQSRFAPLPFPSVIRLGSPAICDWVCSVPVRRSWLTERIM
ncbi:hypothetical protein LXL04_031061 [Taraxacum kok-saghyz]